MKMQCGEMWRGSRKYKGEMEVSERGRDERDSRQRE